jgi:hypothetical protein
MTRDAIGVRPLAFSLMLALAACQAPRTASPPIDPSAHAPPFATVPYEGFSRDSAIAVALAEWRAFGQPVDDDPPDTRPIPPPDQKPERMPGLWQRVGIYWWLGINAGEIEDAWTGKHDEHGMIFPANEDANFAWSAAFISFVMRMAGAAGRFPYAIAHSTYINIAREMSLGQTSNWAITALPPETGVPAPGDLICMGRSSAHSLTFADLPAGHFPGHCDIVVQADPGMLSVLGGNVDDAVTMKHVPITADGHLATPDGTIVDTRYPWAVVIRVLYDR